MTEEPNLHEELADSIIQSFFEKNEDLTMDVELTWQTDLGFRVILSSNGELVRTGHATSLTAAMLRLVEKAEKSVSEYRQNKARREAEYADDDDD